MVILSQALSLIATTAADKAGLFTLKGGLTCFKESIITLDPYPQPTLREASP